MKLIRKDKGMTLLEILLAVSLLAIVMIPLNSFFTDSFVFQSRNQKIDKASKVAEYVLETLKTEQDNEEIQKLINGDEVNPTTLTLADFYAKLGLTTNKNYQLSITSKKSLENFNVDNVYIPDEYDGVVKLTSSGLEYEGTLDCNIVGNTVIIEDAFDTQNIKIANDIGAYSEIIIKNTTSKKINVYKEKGISLSILEGNVSQTSLWGEGQENIRYDMYIVTVKVTESNDDSIVSTLTSTIRRKNV